MSEPTVIAVDLANIEDAWARDGQTVRLTLEGSRSDDLADIARLRSALQLVQDAFEHRVDFGSPYLLPSGPTFVMGADSHADLLEALRSLKGRLIDVDFAGRVEAAGSDVRRWSIDPGDFDRGFTAVAALSGWGEGVRHRAYPAWRNGDEAAQPLASWAAKFLGGAGGEMFLGTADIDHVSSTDIEKYLGAALADQAAPPLVSAYSVAHDGARRTVHFTALGHVIAHVRCQERSSEPVRELLVDAVLPLTSISDYTALLADTNQAQIDLAATLLVSRDVVLPRYYRFRRYFDRQYLPDAFEWQSVTKEHVDRASDLTDWVVEQHGADRFLVTPSRDVEWSGSALQDARLAFGDLIMPADVW